MGLNQPEGLAFDSAGNLFVTDGGSILEFTPYGAGTIFASGLGRAVGLAFDSTGNLFVADQLSGNVDKFTASGMRSTFTSGLSYPFDLAFDSAGNLFVTDWGNGSGHIYKFTPDGVRSTFAELGAPEGLAFDSTGNLFVVDEDTGNILCSLQTGWKHLCRSGWFLGGWMRSPFSPSSRCKPRRPRLTQRQFLRTFTGIITTMEKESDS